jgi:tellurite resistance protein TerC
MADGTILTWTVFNLFVVAMLALDLGVFHKGNKTITVRESLIWSAIWIVVALLFNLGMYLVGSEQKALEFLTVYIVERSLSVDNIFVFIVIFKYFKIEGEYQYKVLFWGILGALVARAIFIVVGVSLIANFHWLMYIFGAMLIYIGIKLMCEEEKEIHPEKNPIVNIFKKIFPFTNEHGNGKFFLLKDGKYYATALFLVLIVVETTDIIFALDSIPAALAISKDSFVIYSANVFAILGLRALYFALAGCLQMFRYLSYGVAAILMFVGAKMLLADLYDIPVTIALAVIALVLAIAIAASLYEQHRAKKSGSCL